MIFLRYKHLFIILFILVSSFFYFDKAEAACPAVVSNLSGTNQSDRCSNNTTLPTYITSVNGSYNVTGGMNNGSGYFTLCAGPWDGSDTQCRATLWNQSVDGGEWSGNDSFTDFTLGNWDWSDLTVVGQRVGRMDGSLVTNTYTPPPPLSAGIDCNGNSSGCTIPYNTSATINWWSQNADGGCSVFPPGWIGTSGSQSTGNLTFDTTYTVGCTGSGLPFTVNASVTVTVSPSPSPISLVNLDFYVKDNCTTNPILGAGVNINQDFGNGTTRTTDGNGFANFGVGQNTTIGWTVSASGYNSSNGNANVGNSDTVVNVNLTRNCSLPTPTPGGGGPTPTPTPLPGGGSLNISVSPNSGGLSSSYTTALYGVCGSSCETNVSVSPSAGNCGGSTLISGCPNWQWDWACTAPGSSGNVTLTGASDCGTRTTTYSVTGGGSPTPTPTPPTPTPGGGSPDLEICASGQSPTTNCGDGFNVVEGNLIQLRAWYDSDGDGQGWVDVTDSSGWILCNQGKNSDLPGYQGDSGFTTCQGVMFEPHTQSSPPYQTGVFRGLYGNVGNSSAGVNANFSGTGDQIGIIVVAPPSTYTVSGYVFQDLNSSGVKDAGESGLAGRTVYLRDGPDTVDLAPPTITDSNGFYQFTGLSPGIGYRIKHIVPVGFVRTTDDSRPFNVPPSEVWDFGLFASTPTASNVTAAEPNYCISGPAATVAWTYSDPSGSPQSAYQVQIDDQGSFNSPEVDSGQVLSGSTSYFTGQGFLQFNTTYTARVRVWNGSNIVSSWSNSSSWKTPNHAYPNINPPYQFTWSPTNPAASSPVQFTDHAWFDPSSNNGQWSWTFVPAGGGSGSSTAQNPSYTFNQSGIYQVTESVRDNALPPGQYCIGPTQAVNIQKPIPIWKEVAPR